MWKRRDTSNLIPLLLPVQDNRQAIKNLYDCILLPKHRGNYSFSVHGRWIIWW